MNNATNESHCLQKNKTRHMTLAQMITGQNQIQCFMNFNKLQNSSLLLYYIATANQKHFEKKPTGGENSTFF